tara:strand:+ start:3463 stop:3867 length:405 start_codon:yes stop_codon:yes gene_type:complete
VEWDARLVLRQEAAAATNQLEAQGLQTTVATNSAVVAVKQSRNNIAKQRCARYLSCYLVLLNLGRESCQPFLPLSFSLDLSSSVAIAAQIMMMRRCMNRRCLNFPMKVIVISIHFGSGQTPDSHVLLAVLGPGI